MKQNFQKNKVFTSKTPFFVTGPFFTHHSICLNIGFWYDSFVWNWYVLNLNLTGFNQRKILQFFEKGFRFLENLVQS